MVECCCLESNLCQETQACTVQVAQQNIYESVKNYVYMQVNYYFSASNTKLSHHSNGT